MHDNSKISEPRETEWVTVVWKFDLQMHGGEDKLSDSDVVFLIDGLPLSEAEKRAHLKKYHCTEDFEPNRKNLEIFPEFFCRRQQCLK